MRSIIAVAAAAWLAAAVPAAAQQTQAPQVQQRVGSGIGLSLSTGVDYSTGDYGLDEDTEILVVPLSLRGTSGRLSFNATLPYIRIDGPGGVVLGPDGQPLPGIPGAAGARDGVGDLSLGATYTVSRDALGGLEIGLGGRVKLPTSPRSRGLTTGETDFSVSADLSYPVGRLIPFVNLGYRFLGDPEGLDLRNGPTASAGASLTLGRSSVLIASYDYARASSPATEDSHELFGGVAAPLGRRLNLIAYGVAGLSRGSPDFGIGLLVSARIF